MFLEKPTIHGSAAPGNQQVLTTPWMFDTYKNLYKYIFIFLLKNIYQYRV